MSGAFRQKELNGLIDAFNAIPEYRKNILNTHHKLIDIIVIAVCGVIAGEDGPASICEWAKIHRESLTRILNLEKGVPSRDTIRRTLQAIRPEVFQQCFLDWIDAKRENNTSATSARCIAVELPLFATTRSRCSPASTRKL